MDIKQRFEDIKQLLKNDRRVLFGCIAALLVIVVWSASSPRKARKVRAGYEMDQPSKQNLGAMEGYQDLLRYVKGDLESLTNASREHQERLERAEKKIDAQQEKTTGVIEMMVERLDTLDENLKQLKEQQSQQEQQPAKEQAGTQQTAMTAEPDQIESYGFNEAPVPPPPLPPREERRSVISPGDSVLVKLLTGVAAPVDGTPYPVVFKLQSPITGPDGSALDLGEARLIAAAQGSETDGRVIYRLTDLAFRHPDGRRTVVKVDGWVVGEDGIRGMKGKVIDKLGQVILATMGYSAAATLGDRMMQKTKSYQINNSPGVSLSGDDLDSATASALTDGATRLTQLMLDKYEKLVPVVEVNAGREVAAVFSKGAEVSLIEDQDESGVYAGSLD